METKVTLLRIYSSEIRGVGKVANKTKMFSIYYRSLRYGMENDSFVDNALFSQLLESGRNSVCLKMWELLDLACNDEIASLLTLSSSTRSDFRKLS